MKFSVIRNDENQQMIYTNEEYDQILEKSNEYLAATHGLGPYIGFGLSYIQKTLTIAIGQWSF